MNILLTAVNAKYIHSNLAVYSLSAYAQERGLTVRVREFTINRPVEQTLAQIYSERPDIVCFSCYIWNITYIEELIKDLHRLLPQLPIWLGGPEVSFETEDFLRLHPEITGIMVGEGEETFYRLMELYDRENQQGGTGLAAERPLPDSIDQIQGICFRREENIVSTGRRQPVAMDDLPFCYKNPEDFEHRIIYYESSRGCPFSCSYCLSSVDKCLRFRSLELVKKELQFFIDHKVPQVKFVDRTFNCNHEHAMEIWKFIREQDQGITNFHFEISADLLTDEETELLAGMRPGLVQLEIGVQSVNPDTIAEIRRTMDLNRLKLQTTRVAETGNIHQHLDLIAGLPLEGMDSFRRSFNEIYALKPNQLQMGFLKVLKGSRLYEHREEYSLVYRSSPPYEVLKTKWLTFDEMIRLKQTEEMLEVYYNSGQFEVTVKILERASEDAFGLYDALGIFYRQNSYFDLSHSRVRRSEILLEFLNSPQFAQICVEMPDVSMVKEALTFDLYYREKAKARPPFAPVYEVPKMWRRRYEKKGANVHVESFTWKFPTKAEKSLKKLPEKCERYWLLFDYDHRDPLDHQAKVSRIEDTPETGGMPEPEERRAAPDGSGK